MQLSRLLIAVAPLLHSATSIMNSSAFTARPSVANKVYTDHLLFHSAVRSRLNCLVMCAFTLGCVRVTHTGERGDSGTCRGHSTQLFPSEQGTSTPGAVTFVWTGLRRVSGEPFNAALNKAAEQSSDYSHGDSKASNAVDGNTNPNYKKDSCTHTRKSTGVASWWQVDLGNRTLGYDVISVLITNRDATDRLRDFDVHVHVQDPKTNPTSGTLCAHHDGPMENALTKELVCPYGPIRGRFVRVTDTPGEYLSLCEVQVMAVPAE